MCKLSLAQNAWGAMSAGEALVRPCGATERAPDETGRGLRRSGSIDQFAIRAHCHAIRESYKVTTLVGPASATRKVRMESKPPLPPFTKESAIQKIRMAEDAWNSRDPERVSRVYTEDTQWRNRAEFLVGRDQVQQFLIRKWATELNYRLIKELWAVSEHRIAVRFAYECHDASGQWQRSYGNENWEFTEQGLMRRRVASINDVPIHASDRKFFWPLGRRPDDHPSLSELGL